MFRAERPQRGRYRQFYQLGAELFGDAGPGCDAEMIDMLVQFLRELRIPDLQVLVNTLGGPETRVRYRAALVEFLRIDGDLLAAAATASAVDSDDVEAVRAINAEITAVSSCDGITIGFVFQ